MHNNLFAYTCIRVVCNLHLKPKQILQISLSFAQIKAKAHLGHTETVRGIVMRKGLYALQQISFECQGENEALVTRVGNLILIPILESAT